MKTIFIKRMSLWIALIMLFSLTVPVTGVFANGNGGAAQNKEGYTMLKIEVGSLKDGQESNDIVTVNATVTEENEVSSISWTSEIPIYFVYVKGGPSGIETEYGNGATKGSGLTAPDNKGISHVAFYYKQEAGEKQNDASEEENSESEEDNSEPVEENNDSEVENDESQEENNESEKENSGSKEENNESEKDSEESTEEDKGSEKDPKENAKKSTEIHLHLKNCKAPVEKVEVQLKGNWVEMSNPGNSPLYKLKDGGEYVKDEITAFRLSFESGEKQIYDMDDVKAGKEAEGSINYWLEGCSIEEDGNNEEPGDGSEEPGDGNGDDNGEETYNKSTEIHLHLKNCVAPVGKVFVELNGEWVEMSNPGNSPLYKLKDGGEFVKDDITAFKLQFESGAERTYSLDEIKIGVEAEGSINYWIENCAVPEDENADEPGDDTEEPEDNNEEPANDEESSDVTEVVKEITIIINQNIKTVVNLTLLIDGGENIEFIKMNNLWKLILTEGLDVTGIKGIKLEFADGTIKVIDVSKLSLELNDQIIHLEVDEEILGIDSEEESDEDEGAGKVDHSDNSSANQGDGKQNWSGSILPKTGESSKMMFYIAGFLLMAAGAGLRIRRPIRH